MAGAPFSNFFIHIHMKAYDIVRINTIKIVSEVFAGSIETFDCD